MLVLMPAALPPRMALTSTVEAADYPAQPGESPPEFLPSDHWAYDELRKLWVAGMVDSLFISARPASRYDVAALLVSLQNDPRIPAGYPPMQRLLREFSREILFLRGDAGYKPVPYMLHSRSEKTDFRLSLYADAEWLFSDETLGDGSRAGIQSRAILRPNLVIYQDVYAGKLSEGWRYGEELFSIEDFIIFSDRFYLSLRTSLVDAEVGRDRVRWGPGVTGTLLLADSTSSYTLLHLTKVFGKKLKVSSVSGILDSEAGKYLAAHRLDFAPASFIQFGLSEAAIYHSRFIEPLYAVSLIPFTLVERILHRDAQSSDLEDPMRNNVSVSADAVLRPVRGASVYGELMIDDLSEETSERPTRLAYQGGLALSRPVGSRSVNLIAELTRVWNYTYNVHYSDVYDRDHTHQGEPLGYYLGPDTRHWYFSLSADVSRDLELAGIFDITYRGEGSLAEAWTPEMGKTDASLFSGVVERTTMLKFLLRWLPAENMLVEASAARIEIENKNHFRPSGGRDWTDAEAEFNLRAAVRW